MKKQTVCKVCLIALNSFPFVALYLLSCEICYCAANGILTWNGPFKGMDFHAKAFIKTAIDPDVKFHTVMIINAAIPLGGWMFVSGWTKLQKYLEANATD